jgi:hypothetical protein
MTSTSSRTSYAVILNFSGLDSSGSENPKIEVWLFTHPHGWNRGISSFRQITPASVLSLSSRVYALVSSTHLVIPRFVRDIHRPPTIVKRRVISDQPAGVYHRNSLPRIVLVSRTRRHLERRPSTRQFSSYPFHHLYFRIVSDSSHSFFCSESRHVPSSSRDELPSEISPSSIISNIRVGRRPLRQ